MDNWWTANRSAPEIGELGDVQAGERWRDDTR